MDTLTPERRSENMRRIKSRDTQPEKVVRKILREAGYIYRLQKKSLPGTPDIVISKKRIAIFVHGCFWHGHKCKDGRRPRSNIKYWNAKLDRNIKRDRKNYRELLRMGWRRIVVWGCQTKNTENLTERLVRLLQKREELTRAS